MMGRQTGPATSTIKDVARRAEVSIGTVSRVINGHSDVDAALKARVEDAMRDLRYRPNVRAQSLVRDRLSIAGFLVSNSPSVDSLHAMLLLGIEEFCAQAGCYVLFSRFQYSSEAAPEDLVLPEFLRQRGVSDCVIVTGNNHANLLDALDLLGIRYVVLANNLYGCEGRTPPRSVRYDDEGGIAEAVRYLAQLGHRDIWYIGDSSQPWHRRREAAFGRAMSEASLAPNVHSSNVHSSTVSDDPFENGHAAVSLLLERSSAITAVVADSVELAYGVKEGLRLHGREVPRDVSVVGFDQLSYSSRLPALTSICVDPIEVGRQLARLAVGRVEPDSERREVLVPMRLVRRSSCWPLRAQPDMLL